MTNTNYLQILIHILLIIFLIICSIKDIRTRTISLKCSIFFGMAISLISIIASISSLTDILLSLIPGLCIIFIGFISHQAIGYGDGIVVLIIGLSIGLKDTLMCCLLAFFLAAIISVVLILKQHSKKDALPFVPFLSGSYLIIILQKIMEVIWKLL